MKIIDFNDNFNGFEDEEDILIDTGVLFAFYNKYDAYYSTVSKLFNNYILNNESSLFLYINPLIIDEITHLSKMPLKQYLRMHKDKESEFTDSDINDLQKHIVKNVKELIENEVLLVLDGDRESVLKQIKLSGKLGSADALNVSIANLYGTSFLTVDRRLVLSISNIQSELPNIRNVYFTYSRHRDY